MYPFITFLLILFVGGGGRGGHVLFQFLCNLQQYCDSAYNKLVIYAKEFINITKINYIEKNIYERGGDTHTHTSKLKFKQLNGPANRSTTILTKKVLTLHVHANNAFMCVVHRVT